MRNINGKKRGKRIRTNGLLRIRVLIPRFESRETSSITDESSSYTSYLPFLIF